MARRLRRLAEDSRGLIYTVFVEMAGYWSSQPLKTALPAARTGMVIIRFTCNQNAYRQ